MSVEGTQLKLPELLAPAGGMEALRAAVENGADAVYLGGQAFNARASAANFSSTELKEAVDYAHERGVKIYVTVNILIDNAEIPELIDYVYHLYRMGVDALLLQDLGVAYLLNRVLPELPIHASTQTTIVNSPGVRLMEEFGFERVVLARETGLSDMRLIQKRVKAELEVFVHGALCVCYSGQCLMSSMIGGRSGNRGRCAQPCRMAYQLISLADKRKVSPTDGGEHLLSTRDLNLLDYLGDLAEAGIDSLKVEGRMKRPEYVATVIRNYRQVLDRLKGDQRTGTAEEHRELAQIFNRDFTPGYLFGCPGPELMSYKRPNNRGVMLGRVQQYNRTTGRALIKLETELNIGDGIEVWTNKGRDGIYVKHIWDKERDIESGSRGQQVWVELPGMVSTGDRIFKTHDEKLVALAKLSYQEGKATRRLALDFKVEGSLGEPLRIKASDHEGNTGEAESDVLLEKAERRPLTEEYLRRQLDRLGNTPFYLSSIDVKLTEGLIVPVREINEVRRKAVEAVLKRKLAAELTVSRHELQNRWDNFANDVKGIRQGNFISTKQNINLAVTVGDLQSFNNALRAGADIIYFGGDAFRSKGTLKQSGLERAVEACKAKGCLPVLQLPRLVAENRLEAIETVLDLARKLGVNTLQAPDLGSLALAHQESKLNVFADYSLNVFNDLSLQALSAKGVRLATLSPELNFTQLERFKELAAYPVELVVHGALPLMITEYCAVGSIAGGCRREKCQRPCVKGRYGLKDRLNLIFPLETDENCRMYVFNAKELNLVEHLAKIIALGVNSLRLELKKDSPDYVTQVTQIYRQEIDRYQNNSHGYTPNLENIEKLAKLRPDGYTKGHYFRGVV
ncbi:MAG TPA: DUF3656 domain-containing protein [Desulfobacteria bacterium]|nr:DUF3656 domain-containing protein [Desulfobacteria bacterium]